LRGGRDRDSGERGVVILLTGATGTVGTALLRRLTARHTPVRCLVRDPKGLGSERVQVQLALGDLADPGSFRNALRGVDTVVHLAASIRDQPRGSIEELNAIATLRLARAAERAGVRHFLHFSALGARLHSPSRFFRAKALARRAVEQADITTTVFSPSIVYARGDPWLKLLERLSLLPAVPIAGTGQTHFQPVWAEDVADCVIAALDRVGDQRRSFQLAGPETLSYDELVRAVLRSMGRRRRLAHIPMPLLRVPLRGMERLSPRGGIATWEEVQLMDEPMLSASGTADAEALGVTPKRIAVVLG